MSEQTLHTPHSSLPWKLSADTEGFGGDTNYTLTSGNRLVLGSGGFSRSVDYGFGRESEQVFYVRIPNQADAEYILEACNSHYTLLEANKRKDALLNRAHAILVSLNWTKSDLPYQIEKELAGTPLPLPSEREKQTSIYPCSKVRRKDMWGELSEDFPIKATRLSEQSESIDFSLLWSRCIEEIKSSAALVCYAELGDELKGAAVEVGAALASGVPVFLVGSAEALKTAQEHPLVRKYGKASLRTALRDAALDAVTAQKDQRIQLLEGLLKEWMEDHDEREDPLGPGEGSLYVRTQEEVVC